MEDESWCYSGFGHWDVDCSYFGYGSLSVVPKKKKGIHTCQPFKGRRKFRHFWVGEQILQQRNWVLIPFVAIQEATDNFNESLVIGVDGFGKVYKEI